VGFERREKAATVRIDPFAIKPDRERCACLITAGYLCEQRDISFQDGPVLDSTTAVSGFRIGLSFQLFRQ
jgi:hypothetical protein